MTMAPIVPVIVCGGAGSRLWPASRESLPKQFIPIVGDKSMFQMTLTRVTGPGFAPPVIITHADFRFLVQEQVRATGIEATILLEPERRDSGPAIAAASAYVGANVPGGLVLILPSDHLVTDVPGFQASVRTAAEAAQAGRIVTFGMRPDRPHTGYGYIRPGRGDGPVLPVERFVEKPDAPTAAGYIADGYLWNGGMFLFRPDMFASELARFQPEIAKAAAAAVAQGVEDLGFLRLDPAAFASAPKISVDYAVMEHTAAASVLPCAFGWSDVGNWNSVWEASERDADGNATRGPVEMFDASNCLVQSDGALTVVAGVQDLVVVVENDAVMITHRDASENVKQVVADLKAKGHASVTSSRTVYRPWGYYTSLDQGGRHQVKRIVVNPGAKLSLQSHFHRAEHWVVVSGIALVTRDHEEILVRENESIYLPLGCKHRMHNPGRIPLALIEVQSGSYLGEDDIVRYEDVYNRS